MTTNTERTFNISEMKEDFYECERKIYNTLSRFSQRLRKLDNTSNSFKKYLIQTDRNTFANDVLELLNGFLDEIKDATSFTLNQIESVAVARSMLSERFAVLWQIRVLINDVSNASKIQESLTSHFGNEHTWKKEVTEEFLRVLYSYEKNPSEDKKNNLLHRLSILSSNIVRTPKDFTNFEDYQKMSSDALKKEREKLHKDAEVLIELRVRAEKLKHCLLKVTVDI